MKKLVLFILVGIIFSFPSFSEWKEMGEIENENQGKYYIESNSIVKDSGNVFFWKMLSWRGANEYGTQSVKIYIKGDCKIKRIKTLSYVMYTGSKGTGESETQESKNINWKYPTPENIDYNLLEEVC